jgi:hypothetical protein
MSFDDMPLVVQHNEELPSDIEMHESDSSYTGEGI